MVYHRLLGEGPGREEWEVEAGGATSPPRVKAAAAGRAGASGPSKRRRAAAAAAAAALAEPPSGAADRGPPTCRASTPAAAVLKRKRRDTPGKPACGRGACHPEKKPKWKPAAGGWTHRAEEAEARTKKAEAGAEAEARTKKAEAEVGAGAEAEAEAEAKAPPASSASTINVARPYNEGDAAVQCERNPLCLKGNRHAGFCRLSRTKRKRPAASGGEGEQPGEPGGETSPPSLERDSSAPPRPRRRAVTGRPRLPRGDSDLSALLQPFSLSYTGGGAEAGGAAATALLSSRTAFSLDSESGALTFSGSEWTDAERVVLLGAGEQPVAVAVVRVHEPLRVLEVPLLAVAKQSRGLGRGALLAALLVGLGRRLGLQTLVVPATEDSRGFWLKQGLRERPDHEQQKTALKRIDHLLFKYSDTTVMARPIAPAHGPCGASHFAEVGVALDRSGCSSKPLVLTPTQAAAKHNYVDINDRGNFWMRPGGVVDWCKPVSGV